VSDIITMIIPLLIVAAIVAFVVKKWGKPAIDGTPMRFHSVICYVLLPINIITSIRGLIETGTNMDAYIGTSFEWVSWVDMTLCVILITLSVAAIPGLIKRKPYAYKAIFLICSLKIISSLYIIVVYYLYLPDDALSSWSSLIGVLAVLVPVMFYYKKRRHLFGVIKMTPRPEVDA